MYKDYYRRFGNDWRRSIMVLFENYSSILIEFYLKIFTLDVLEIYGILKHVSFNGTPYT